MASEILKSTLHDLQAELRLARSMYPQPVRFLGALMEECGELARELENLHELHFKEALSKKHSRVMRAERRIREEALQVAVVALRIIEEGDSGYEFKGARS